MPPTRDWLLALAMTPVQLAGALIVSVPVYVYDTGGNPPVRLASTELDWLGVSLLVLSALVLVVRSTRPRLALWLAVGLFAAYMAGGYPVGPVVLPVMLCLLTVALTGRHRREVLLALAVSVLAAARWAPRIVALYQSSPASSAYGDAATATGTVAAFLGVVLAIFGGPVLLGEMVSSRREAAEAKIAQARREAERRVVEERLRIARELHDVVAHSMAGIAVQAAATLRLLDRATPPLAAPRAEPVADPVPVAVAESVAAIRLAAKEALASLRETVGDLRQGGAQAEGLERLDTLLDAVRNAGVPVVAEIDGARPVPEATGHAAYRCVQESLTNVLRHAGPGVTARVLLRYGKAELSIEVTDDGPGAAGAPATGHGLAGMRERCQALGGRVTAGDAPGGGFRVLARLPL